jgi:putative ABC transport system permease protein
MPTLHDLSYAIRSLRKRPGFAVAAVVTLTIGIGANLTVFTLVNAMLLRPLPFGERSDRIVTVHSTHRLQAEDWGWGDSELSYADLLDLRAAQSFEGLAGYLPRNFTVTDEDDAERVQGGSVTPDLFSVLGVEPMLGRSFLAEEAAPPGLESAVILTHGLWQRRYGGDPGIVGRGVVINDRARTVVGVMPPAFKFPERDELYLPLRWDDAPRSARNVNVVGAVRPGVSLQTAQSELDAIAARLSETYPETNRGFGVRVLQFRESQLGSDERALSVALMAAVGFVLLIACANLANLFLVRGAARQREIAVRAAMGASRSRLLSHVLAESLVLSAAGAALGLLASQWSLDFIQRSFPEELPFWLRLELDMRVGLFALAAAAFTALATGLLPALRAARASVAAT